MSQPMAALAVGNKIRTKRKNLKAKLKARAITIQQVIQKPPPYLSTAKVGEVLEWAPYIGENKAHTTLHLSRVPSTKQMAHLSPAEKLRLIEALGQASPSMKAAA